MTSIELMVPQQLELMFSTIDIKMIILGSANIFYRDSPNFSTKQCECQ